MDGLLKIGELARQAGVNLQTVIYYERRGLIPKPRRTASNYRVFTADAIQRVRFIKRAQELGFTLHEIEELMALRDSGSRRKSDVRAVAEAKIRDIDRKAAWLAAIRRTLSDVVDACACGTGPETCPILEALDDPNDECIAGEST
jgi:MerR family transcriptional regulator, copper efflux regulator